MAELPSGTVTFLFTDVEGSTRLWEEHPDAMQPALARHDELLRGAVEAHGGHVVKTTGDGVHAAFATADDAIRAAIAGQRLLAEHDWSEVGSLKVRMGLHTGTAEVRDGDYYGSSLNRAARLMAVAHGGQIVCSRATADLARDSLSEGVVLTDLGEHRLRDLSRPEEVFQICADGLEAEFAALLSLDAFPGNLPLQLTSLVGRERDLVRVIDALDEARVVSLTGVGGVGKTRLALQVAADVLPRFQFGAWLCELAAVRSTEGVVDAVAAVFDVTARSGQTLEQAVVDFLRHKNLLLVLDNCEHVLDEAAALVEVIERSCPKVQVLATSREGLGIDGERILAVPSLAAPRVGGSADEIAGADSVRLFVERARALKADFAVTAENADAVAQVCRRLDGMPLAIELAAARVPAMNPGELAARLDSRFQVLAGGRRGKVERHQTLRAVIDWSYDLLSPAEQRLLDRVTVFTGGWTLDAAEAVCAGDPVARAEVFGLMERLVARSLVIAEDQGFQTRFRLLETIRQYGEERLAEIGETDDLRQRHASYYLQLVRDLAARMEGPEQIQCGERLAAEHENLLAAVGLALDLGDVDTALAWVGAVPATGAQVGYQFRLPAEAMLALPGAREHEDAPRLLALAGFLAAVRGDSELSVLRLQEARVAQEERGRESPSEFEPLILTASSTNAFGVGNWAEAARLLHQGTEAWRAVGRQASLAYALAGTAALYATAGDTDAAIPLATEGLALARETGMPSAIAMNLSALANALADQEPERAAMLIRESLEFSARLGYENTNESSEAVLVAARLRDWSLAREVATRAIPHLHWTGDRPQLAGVLNVVARAVVDDDPDAAGVLQGASRRIALASVPTTTAAVDVAPPPAGAQQGMGLVAAVRHETTGILEDVLGGERRRELRAVGEAMDEDQATTYALDAIRRARAGSS